MINKIGQATYQDDLEHIEQNTHSRDLFRLAQARRTAISQTNRQPNTINWLLATACGCLFAFLVMVPLFEDSPLSVEAIVSGEQPIKSMIGEDISEVDSMGFYYWLEIYDVELVANND
jgi:hypothetical protein